MATIALKVNEKSYVVEAEPRTLLVELLRERLLLTGTHVGCDTSQCGACTVWVDGRVGEELHHAGGGGRWRRGHHDRGAGEGRQAAPDAGGLPHCTASSAASARPAW